MSSPVSINLQTVIKIDREKHEAVYLQVVYQLINAIKANLLEDGDKLPGSRRIAGELNLHRKTVVAALNELQEQGWIETKPGIGTFIKNPEKQRTQESRSNTFIPPPQRAAFLFKRNFILDPVHSDSGHQLKFTDGTPDFRVVPPLELSRFYSGVLKRKSVPGRFSIAEGENSFFKTQLSFYLNQTRKFHISRDFLLPVPSREQVFTILAQLLIKPGDRVLVAGLSYFLPNMIFSQAGARLQTIFLDKEGIRTADIKARFKKGEIRLVYLNARCQYPTTVALSKERKTQLVQLAEELDFIILEDDPDFESAPERNTEKSIFRKYGGNRIIYTGIFGRFLTPGFQTSFIIGPGDLIEEGRKYLGLFGKPDLIKEQALGEMIRQGDIHRYRRKFQKVVKDRKDQFSKLLKEVFGEQACFLEPEAGLAFWILLRMEISLIDLRETAVNKGLFIPRISLYQKKGLTGLRLGFAHLNEEEMAEAIRILKEACERCLSAQQNR